MKRWLVFCAVMFAWLSGRASAQDTIAQPGHEIEHQARGGEPTAGEEEHGYGAEAVIPGELHEEDRIGDYGQPRWTARRRFPTTRVYVLPRGQIGFEWWLETKLNLEDTDEVRHRSQYEVEFGLGNRLQLDLYLQTEQLGWKGPFELKAEKVELRYALADWGVIPLNPTVYIEFAREHDGPPVLELKALAGDELAPRVHFGLNLVYERQLGDDQEAEYALTAGLSYTLIDDLFSIGLEAKYETVDAKGDRLTFENWELLAGPSFSWTPTHAMHILFVGLFGNETEGDENVPLFEPTLIAGWDI